MSQEASSTATEERCYYDIGSLIYNQTIIHKFQYETLVMQAA